MMNTMTGDQAETLRTTDIAEAAGALFYRCGDPNVEARRRSTLRAALRASRELARALEEFAKQATAHYQGIHCTSHMNAEVAALTQAFTDWSFSVHETALLHRECREPVVVTEPFASRTQASR